MDTKLEQLKEYRDLFADSEWDKVIDLVEANKVFRVTFHTDLPEMQIGAYLKDFVPFKRWISVEEI